MNYMADMWPIGKTVWVAACGFTCHTEVQLLGPVFTEVLMWTPTELAPRVPVVWSDLFDRTKAVNLTFSGLQGTATRVVIYDSQEGGNELFFTDIPGVSPGDTLMNFGFEVSNP